MLPSKLYDILKPVAQVWLPALGAAYFSLAQIWGLPEAEEVVGTITIIDTFLGVGLGVSTSKFNDPAKPAGKYDGDVSVTQTALGKQMVNLSFNIEPEVLMEKRELLLKVQEVEAA